MTEDDRRPDREVELGADARHRPLLALALALCALAIGAFLVLRLLAPFRSTGPDEAYYLGIGANLLAGRGLETVFGEFPSIHSPLWTLVLQAPAAWLGIEPQAWGHPLVVLCAALVIGLAGWYAWRSIRLAAPLAVASLIGFPYLSNLAGSMGLDLPSAALGMLYVALGIAAVRRGSLALGLAAGLLFAVAFLIKELALPFAPVPILAGLLRGVPLASIGRSAAGILLAAAIGTSWWFVIHAQELGVVYRLGTPAWTLVPIAVGAIALVVLGLVLGRVVPWAARPLDGDGARRAARLGWLGTIAWAGLLTAYFAVAPNPIGAGFLVPAQVAASLERFGPGLWPLLSVALTGAAIAVVDRVRPALLAPPPDEPSWSLGLLRPDDRHAVDELLVATLCGFPFVLLIVSIGEGPRHYIANLGFLVALGAIGWTKLLVAVARRPHRLSLTLLGLGVLVVVAVAVRFPGPSRLLLAIRVVVPLLVVGLALGARVRRSRSLAVPAARAVPGFLIGGLLLILLGGSAWVMAGTMPTVPVADDQARTSAIETASTWVREHLPRGSTVAFGPGLAMETAIHLTDEYRTAKINDETGIEADPSAPLGLRALDGTNAGDWVVLWASRRDVTSFYGYRAQRVTDTFRSLGPSVWIQTVNSGVDAPAPILEALARAKGIEAIARWTWPLDVGRLETVVYRVDPLRLAFSDDVVIDRGALERLVEAMERDPDAYAEAAATLLDRAVVVPPGPASSELLGRLRDLAAR